MKRPKIGLSLILVALLMGCSGIPVKRKDGTINHLIIGIGVVSVPSPEQSEAVTAVRSQVLGLNVSNQPGPKFTLGYGHASVVVVPVDAEAYVDVSMRPFGPLKIEQTKPKLEGANHEQPNP